MTAAMTWPYVTRLRDAVVDPGDPYLVAWILWWDYHQTFSDPLNLFHANIFYPYRYTLAFSEHSYGLALLCFPLFALGLRPLTVHAVAMFLAFAACGYGAFRLARTLTGSYGVAWVAGIIFAFVPDRFNMMSQLPYLFSPWIPLLMEALVFFVRERNRKRASWLGFAFFMTGLTTVSWFTLSLVPFLLATAVLLTRYGLWRERAFWARGAVALGAASLALVPFMLPYYIVAKTYGFTRRAEELKANSALPIHWFSVGVRNKFWSRFGSTLHEGWKFKLFPGLLPIMLSLASIMLVEPLQKRASRQHEAVPRKKTLAWLDAFIVCAFAASVFAIGFEGTSAFLALFNYITSERALAALFVAIMARLCIAYPAVLQGAENSNLIDTLRSPRRSDAYWLGLLWVVVGFCYSLGWNFFFYRILYDLVPFFRSMRVVTRGAMIAYLGLAILAGLGTKRLAELVAQKWPRVPPLAVYSAACVLLLMELNAAPLSFIRGDVFPDAVTLRLKGTPMRGGIVVLPAGASFNHHHILRSADHAKPLIVGTSGFNSPYEDQIEWATNTGSISQRFMDLLEKIPTSYLVVKNEMIAPQRKSDYDSFLARAVALGRLRFVKRFDGRDDLYAVIKIEPETRSEAVPPFEVTIRDWAEQLEGDPINLLGQYAGWSQKLFRLHVAMFGSLPRYTEFIHDAQLLGRGVISGFEISGFEGEDRKLEGNLRELAHGWTRNQRFRKLYDQLDNAQYVDRLLANAAIDIASDRAALIADLSEGAVTRSDVLLKIVVDQRFVEKERYRAPVVLHYFGYFQRNPDDAPDNDLRGMQHWIEDLQRYDDPARLSAAFKESGEYQELKRRR